MTMATAEAGEGASPPSDQPARGHSASQRECPQPAATAAAAAAAASTAANICTVSELPMAHNSYVELSPIGSGAYGTVYLGRDKTHANRLVALKKIRITLTDDGVPVNAVREIALLKQLEKFEHPNIVRLLDICHGRLERESRLTLILVFEYVEQDLDSFLRTAPEPSLEPATIKSLMHQVLCGVDFLHQHRIIHRDLKPQNLLVDRFHRIKIADFGLARIYDFHMRLTTMVVTLWYRAPEVLLSNSYATPVDVWSCGCIFAELYRRRPLFEGQTEGDQLQRIFDVIGKPSASEWPKDVSLSLSNFRDHIGKAFRDVVPEITPDAADLLGNLLKFVPGTRVCASDALKHPYFRGMAPPCLSSASASARGTTPSPSPLAAPPANPSTTASPSSSSTTTFSTSPSPLSLRHAPTAASSASANAIPSSTHVGVTSSSKSSSSASSHDNSSSSSNLNSSSSSSGSSGGESGSSAKQLSTNDENNPNAGNNAGLRVNNNNNNNHHSINNNNTTSASSLVLMTDPKMTDSTPPPAASPQHALP